MKTSPIYLAPALLLAASLLAPPTESLALKQKIQDKISMLRDTIEDALGLLIADDAAFTTAPLPRDIPPSVLLIDALDSLDVGFIEEEAQDSDPAETAADLPVDAVPVVDDEDDEEAPRDAQSIVESLTGEDFDEFVKQADGFEGNILRTLKLMNTASESEIDSLGHEVVHGFNQVDKHISAIEEDIVKMFPDGENGGGDAVVDEDSLNELERRADEAVSKVGKVAALLAIRESFQKNFGQDKNGAQEESFHERALDAEIESVEEKLEEDIERLHIAERLAEDEAENPSGDEDVVDVNDEESVEEEENSNDEVVDPAVDEDAVLSPAEDRSDEVSADLGIEEEGGFFEEVLDFLNPFDGEK